MVERILLHTGFHRTGTTTLQTFLSRNRAALAPDIAVALLENHPSGALARKYGELMLPHRLHQFTRAFAESVLSLPDAPTLIISRESLSGPMPGARGGLWPVRRYSRAAVPLGRAMLQALRARFPAARVELVHTVRAAAEWHASATAHTSKRRGRPAKVPAQDLVAEARAIAAKVKPDAHHLIALEDCAARPGGPGSSLLDIAGLPPDRAHALTPVPPQYVLRRAP